MYTCKARLVKHQMLVSSNVGGALWDESWTTELGMRNTRSKASILLYYLYVVMYLLRRGLHR